MLYVYIFLLCLIIFVIYILRDINKKKSYDYSENLNQDEYLSAIKNYSRLPKKKSSKVLIKKLDRSFSMIIRGYEYFDREIRNSKEIVPAAEWLLDNLYLIEKEYKDIKHNMPEICCKKMPVMREGAFKDLPRAYYLGVKIINKLSGKISEDSIISCVQQYQKSSMLTSSELWALPLMFRMAVIQNISRIIESIVFAQREKRKADKLGFEIIDSQQLNVDRVKKVLMNQEIMTSHFIERFVKSLRDNGVDDGEIYEYIDTRLQMQETTTSEMVVLEHKRQAEFQVLMGNCVNAIREIEALNWKSCFEKLSIVESILREDAANIYSNMDFSSKDYYRHNIEKMANRFKMPESFIAKAAVKCAKEDNSKYDIKKHIGYYIIDNGVNQLKYKIGLKSKKNGILNLLNNHSVGFYIGVNILGTIALSYFLIYLIFRGTNDYRIWPYALGFFAILVPCSEIVNAVFNWSINHLTTPKFVCKLELPKGIPDYAKTVVVIPAILNSEKKAKELIDRMEVFYLANKEKNLYFALLGDLKDSRSEVEEADHKINEIALNAVNALNRKYHNRESEIFFFFNRARKFNKGQGKWIGWERKRGKLMEFNSLLRGDKNTSYNVISGNLNELYKAKYIITLDEDTKMPRDTGKKLIGAMIHVLNKAVINNGRVVRGYGVMQPRININSISANKTIYSKVFSGEAGIDTYSTAVSDVYQDLFGEGIFAGKGIYDIDVFQTMLKNQIPENTVLSHDLLEGAYVRSALVTDVELIDGYPAYYSSSSKRLHRWVRGDWQLLKWIFIKSPINTISKWKIFDNLRRSLIAPAIMILIILSITILPYNPDKWLAVAFLSMICPWLFDVSEMVVSPIRGMNLSGKIVGSKVVIEQMFLIFSFLPYKAYLMVDAIIRSLYRVFISKKNLLQWQTSADSEMSSKRSLKDYVNLMWFGSFIAVVVGIMAFYRNVTIGAIMMPLSSLWFVSPFIAYFVSKENIEVTSLSKSDAEFLRINARKTYAYFEDFINEEGNFLAPDNYQEYENKGIAFRTSPTNMGMGLTSNLVAYDLGFIGVVEFTERMDKILTSMESLEMYKGHFYNWYDTKTKNPLSPRYISTVDSGNLVSYLWLISKAIDELKEAPMFNFNFKKGLVDNLNLASEEIKNNSIKIEDYYKDIKDELVNEDSNLDGIYRLFSRILEKESYIGGKIKKENVYWNMKLKNSVNKIRVEFDKLMPWIDIFNRTNVGDGYIYGSLNETALRVSFKDVPKKLEEIKLEIRHKKNNIKSEIKEEYKRIIASLDSAEKEINEILKKLQHIQNRINIMAENTNFKMLFDKKRELFSIGYDIESDSLGKSYYDLLASEARQASFIAIAKGEINQNHWFKLGRSLTNVEKERCLVSWSGTMFEYLMPIIIMRSYPNTLLSETYKSVVESQKKYCRRRKIPCWGISESAYSEVDSQDNYMYKAFGVPGIGLKRGLSDEFVISPYSSLMALQVDTRASVENMRRLLKEGAGGKYGFYEAIDYTKERLKGKNNKLVVKCFMVHHEGMSLMSLDNVINDNILQKRFHSIPRVKSAELLLQERMPKRVIYNDERAFEIPEFKEEKQRIIKREYFTAKTEFPEVQILSNGTYSVMLSNSGSGYSKCDREYIYRWRKDSVEEGHGMFFYIKDLNANKWWSAGYEPCQKEGDRYKATFSIDKANITREDEDVVTSTTVVVSSEENAEIRRVSIKNKGSITKLLEITSYMEVIAAPFDSDLVHPTFSNLFVRTEFEPQYGCLIARRRIRSEKEKKSYVVHSMAYDGKLEGNIQYETSRTNFIGRGKDIHNPEALNSPLKNTVGDVLDPVMSLRGRIKLEPGKSINISYITAISPSRESALEIAKKYSMQNSIRRIFAIATTEVQLWMKYLNMMSSEANLYEMMAAQILYLNENLYMRSDYIKNISKAQPALWGYGISGDIPIMLLIVREDGDIGIVRQMVRAHEYFEMKGLNVDLIIINLMENSYTQDFQDLINGTISKAMIRLKKDRIGKIFAFNRATMPVEDMNFLIGVAKLVIDSAKGLLIHQLKKQMKAPKEIEKIETQNIDYNVKDYKFKINSLRFFNDYGGFDEMNNEYVIILNDSKNTPAPWINVISNEKFGFHISERGSAYTWCANSRENKITPWNNDPVSDTLGEALYIRDEVTGKYWSLSPEPVRDNDDYIIEHGFGYSRFSHYKEGIIGNMTMFVPMYDNVKLLLVKLKNNTEVERKLSASYYARMVLGVVPEHTEQYISTELDLNGKIIYSKNPYSTSFGDLNAFLKIAGGENESFTGSRREFIGRGNNLHNPSAMKKVRLSNTVGSGLEPCIAENVTINLKPNEEKEIVIMLGEEKSRSQINIITSKYSIIENAERELKNTKEYWKSILNTVVVNTPDESMNIIMNGWLMYQLISCRLWSRTAFYQSGGAYGFRDQLQDTMPLTFVRPEMTRKQILISASRQFIEGDVQHWWHPVVDSGIRTRFSDDLLWLPYVTIDYIKNTGDTGILDEIAPYIEDDPLREGEDERYSMTKLSDKKGTIYEHCIKAIDKALKFGIHNIPLMGSGDWNDGMNTVGNKGKGESVWLGWFLYSILINFKDIARVKGDNYRSGRYLELSDFIKESIDKNAWDGNWYRRAYFDDGTPLGSAQNDECQIDSLSQSWALISGGGKIDRAKVAMQSIEKYLVKEDKGMILLLTPPFDESKLNPGYIKGYVPGVRENGGQYTHAATWVILAMTKLGDGKKAWKLFNMINPINHSRSFYDCQNYKVEPYVMAADVYAKEPHEGRGGWTWYTGTAGWMYRVGLEGILGLKLKEGRGFTIEPCVPNKWYSYNMEYRYKNSVYNINIRRGEKKEILLDGRLMEDNVVPFLEEGNHRVDVTIEKN
ncbi:GH36-type glycosyl hydrolase domain-containing protein [Clostridium felsineum]|uniref:GH36-type glycosyl hydrolase domain-containing protein n=1 Tax=Clostridium felsineum TaxID=36839 RepID=UPI00098CEABE|nr:glucoamylase family protein [Clostridium felsineum]URZ17704.1 Cyclic beta-(1,2)-glucan synthase NdvB [Clostridium felsineum DSM 794]